MGYVVQWRRNEKGESVRELVLEHEVNVSLVGMGARNMRGEGSVVEAQGREPPEPQAALPQAADGPTSERKGKRPPRREKEG